MFNNLTRKELQMKKILTIWLILIIALFSKKIAAKEVNMSSDEILNQQQQELRNITIYRRVYPIYK